MEQLGFSSDEKSGRLRSSSISWCFLLFNMWFIPHRIHGAIYGNMDPINIPPLCEHIYQHHGSIWILWVLCVLMFRGFSLDTRELCGSTGGECFFVAGRCQRWGNWWSYVAFWTSPIYTRSCYWSIDGMFFYGWMAEKAKEKMRNIDNMEYIETFLVSSSCFFHGTRVVFLLVFFFWLDGQPWACLLPSNCGDDLSIIAPRMLHGGGTCPYTWTT